MRELVKMWIFTLIVMTTTIILLIYGLYYCDFTIFLAGDLLGWPTSFICYLAYRKEYYEYINNVRGIK